MRSRNFNFEVESHSGYLSSVEDVKLMGSVKCSGNRDTAEVAGGRAGDACARATSCNEIRKQQAIEVFIMYDV